MSIVEYYYEGQHYEDSGDAFEAAKYYAECTEIAIERNIKTLDSYLDETELSDAIVASYAHNSLSGLYLDAATNDAKQGAMREDSELVSKAIYHAKQAIKLWKENLMAYINLGNVSRAIGKLNDAMSYFQSASNIGEKMNLSTKKMEEVDWIETWVREPQRRSLSISLYMLALCRSISGDHKGALNPLRKFGIQYRIAPHVWREVNSSSTSSSSSLSTSCHLARQFANVVPKQIGNVLRRAFSPDSSYWDATNYSNRGYFSFWYDIKYPPSNAVEVLIRDHFLPLLDIDTREKIVGWYVFFFLRKFEHSKH